MRVLEKMEKIKQKNKKKSQKKDKDGEVAGKGQDRKSVRSPKADDGLLGDEKRISFEKETETDFVEVYNIYPDFSFEMEEADEN